MQGASDAQHYAEEKARQATDASKAAYDQASDKANDASQQGKGLLSTVIDAVASTVVSAKNLVVDNVVAAKDTTYDTAKSAQHYTGQKLDDAIETGKDISTSAQEKAIDTTNAGKGLLLPPSTQSSPLPSQ